MRWRLPETITFTLKIISAFSSNKVETVLLHPWCLSLPWVLCKPWAALTWIHAWRCWKRKTLHHLKENKVSVFKCMGAVAYATCGELPAAKHSSLQQSRHYFQLRCDKGQCWVSRHDGSLWQEQQVVELTSASASQTELKHFETWNSPCLKTDHQLVEQFREMRWWKLEHSWPRDLSLRKACS